MRKWGKNVKTIYAAVLALAVISSLTAATYAWFSVNQVTTTSMISAKTDVKNISLKISGRPGESSQGQAEAPITCVNSDAFQRLMPVSTADLTAFFYNPYTEQDQASVFHKLDTESYYYHGRVYLQAVAEGFPEGGRLRLYLDESEQGGGAILQNATGTAANALRLGIQINQAEGRILRLSDTSNEPQNQWSNTVLQGKIVEGEVVLAAQGEEIAAVPDPSVSYKGFCVGEDGIPAAGIEPLALLNFNQEYVIDIYVYLEGCDPDCVNAIMLEDFDFHLGFYGIAEEGVGEP